MGQIKRWQIVLFALALVGVGVMTFYSCTGSTGPEIARSVNLVDVKSGVLFLADYPEKRPVSASKRTHKHEKLARLYDDEILPIWAHRFGRMMLRGPIETITR